MSLCILTRASVVVLPPDDVETRNHFSLGIHVAFHGATAGLGKRYQRFLARSLNEFVYLD
jgi:hypothetical protein